MREGEGERPMLYEDEFNQVGDSVRTVDRGAGGGGCGRGTITRWIGNRRGGRGGGGDGWLGGNDDVEDDRGGGAG